jgi:voltage-gated potassium channel
MAQVARSEGFAMRDLRSFFYHFFLGTHLVRYILAGLTAMLVTVTLVIWWAEQASFGVALYLTLITGLTVGYGDISPTTLAGRVASIVAAMLGLVISGIYVALATNAVQRCLAENHPDGMPRRASAQTATREAATDG